MGAAAVVEAGLPGVVVVASGPDSYREEAAGLANLETGEPMTPGHRFRVASVMKPFVAAVVLQLVDEGALTLDGGAEPVADAFTVRQLLNHTSGLPNPLDDLHALFEPYRKDPAYRWPVSWPDLLAATLEKPRLFPPGEGWAYTGGNYLALGLLVEETTGSTLHEELRRRIFEPLELEATELSADVSATDGLARGYIPGENPVLPGPRPVDCTELDLPFNWAGGGIVSTGRDLARFLQALLGGELFSAEMRAELLRTVPSDWDESDAYGLGVAQVSSVMGKAPSPCGPAWGHLGLGYYTTIALASEDGARQAVVLANGDVATDEAWEALGRLFWSAYCD